LGGAEDSRSRRLLSVHEAAAYLGLSHWTVRDLLHAGTIRPVRLPVGDGKDVRRLLLDRHDLDALVENSKG
jgi:excisionase family DNA binding protein